MHVPHQSNSSGIETGGHRDFGSFRRGFDRLHGENSFEHSAAIAMDIADGRADLRVVVIGDRLLEKVHEPRFALKRGQQVQGIVARRRARAGAGLRAAAGTA